MHVETHDFIEHFLLRKIDRCRLGQSLQDRADGFAGARGQEQRIGAKPRVAHQPLDDKSALGHEHAPAAPQVGVSHVSIVRQSRIVEIFDPDRLHREIQAQGTKTSPLSPADK